MLVILAALLNGCATYHISTESLLQQFVDVQPEKKVTNFAPTGGLIGALLFTRTVEGNSLNKITVLDAKEQQQTLNVTRATSVRITKKDGKKVTFYFNTLLLKDSTITGSKTHFVNAKIKPVRFADIDKIELQKH
jgi:hypothetical protein